jgi:2-isopropylmalate synthase
MVQNMTSVKLYDTTLRDGSQAEGISYSVIDKIRITQELDKLGMHFIEGGWPGSNPKDREFFEKISQAKLKNSKITAFSMTRRPNITAGQDSNLLALLKSKAQAITIVGKTWDFHVLEVLKTTLDENLAMIHDSVSFLVKKGFLVFYDAEHFFDAYQANKDYALKTLIAAQDAGCSCLCLCDTNGGSLTRQISSTINEIKGKIKVDLGIHCHNDSGVAVANSLVAVEAGVNMVQGTINGYGERCGNADLIAIIANLKIKFKIDCIPDAQLKQLTHLWATQLLRIKEECILMRL